MAIPVSLFFGWVTLAKIVGVFTVMLLSFSIRFWLNKTKKVYEPKERIRINLNDRFWMKRELVSYNKLNTPDKKVLEDRIGVLLSKVPICQSSGELIRDREMALRIAVHILNNMCFSEDFPLNLPKAVILDVDNWHESMNLLRNQTNVSVVSSELLRVN